LQNAFRHLIFIIMKVKYSEEVKTFLSNHEAGNALVQTIIENSTEIMKGEVVNVVLPNGNKMTVTVSSTSSFPVTKK